MMAGKRRPITLRKKRGAYVADIYRPDGRRTTVSFGAAKGRTVSEIHVAFSKWLDLFKEHPSKVLSFSSPYGALDSMIHPGSIQTVRQLVDSYAKWAGQYLMPLRDGRPHPDLSRVERLRRFLKPYLDWKVADFGSDELKTVQEAMVDYRYTRPNHEDEPIPYTRSGVNQVINVAHKIWQWAVTHEIATDTQARKLREVRSLRPGRTPAKDKPKRTAVTEKEFNAVTDNLTDVVADMLQLIWITAMRPGEVIRMRPYDISRQDQECWLYIPGRDASRVGDHKTAYRQRIRVIPLTRKAQEILRPRITDFDSKEPIFRPTDAMQEMRDRRFANRETPISQGNRANTNRKLNPMITPGERYTVNSLYTAVRRACQRADVERFTPYDLRRTAATRVRAALGKEEAKLLLGHVSIDTTEIYLLDEVKETVKAAKRMEVANSA